MNESNCILDIPADEYHAETRNGRYLSSHMLGDFRRCPALYQKKLAGQIEENESAAFAIGRATHKLILEGRSAFDEEYTIADGPVNPKTGEAFGKTTKAYSEWLALQRKAVVPGKDFGFILKLQIAVWLHPVAARLLTGGVAEGVVRANYCDEPCQIRMDFYSLKLGMVDLKTCDTLDWFESDARRYGYIHQLAFYRAILRERLGGNVPIHIIAVEKKEPFRCGVWRITDEALEFAEMENRAAIGRLQECRRTANWPTGYEEVRIIDNI